MNPHGEDIEGMTHCLTDYLNFCADVVSPVKTVRCYPNNNNKPWVTREVKTVLNKKKAAFRSRDREAMKAAQQEVKHCVKEAKDSYRRKVEQKLRENNMREVWEGVRTITGLNTKTRAVGGTMERANELNDFFNRFNQPLAPPPPPSPQPSPPSPLHTSPSRHHNTTPLLPHINTIFATHHHRPASSDPRCSTPKDRLQFAYQPGVGVEDAILYLLHRAHSHLDKGSGTVRILFLDFSSAFNTIQPTLLRDKLGRMGVDSQLMDWISDYLTGRPQLLLTTRSCVIFRNTLTTQPLLGASGRTERRSKRRLVGDFAAWCHTLTTYSSTPLRRRSWLLTLGGPDQDRDQSC
ncbi:hypothetical protein L3Q82_010402 [Scortum barcoo]|uniref:Uncharacterized protein n=1 Tax=Scortum barcoo TaxID=214431 RepID=A0ACB8WBU7_9TELE|nr:hypothetical protein L3Q82_010402 [Scortum barcoo]